MFRITDMTLSCMDTSCADTAMLRRLFELLSVSGADFVEMPAALYERLGPETAENIVLRIFAPEEAAAYPEITRFVCRRNGFAAGGSPAVTILREIQMNDIREIALLGPDENPADIRITGLDDVLCHDYEAAFKKIRSRSAGRVEFCPENSRHCATAAAVEWLSAGGTELAASFGGIGGKAALEEVLLALRVVRRYRPGASFAVLPRIAGLLEEITSGRFSDRKAVIGRSIFDVESGIHVDGILKRPQMYEPFLPELVGGARRFVIGKHSGRKSVAAKLNELGAASGDYDIAALLAAVREASVGKLSSLTDAEFLELAGQYRL